VKLWSISGELWGDIYLLKESYDKKWKYPFNWMQKKDQDIEKVKTLMSIVEGSGEVDFRHPKLFLSNNEEEVVFAPRSVKEKLVR